MLDDKDIQKLIEVFATKDEIKAMIEPLVTMESFDELLTSVDAYSHKADGYMQEMTMLTGKVNRHEKWLLQIAEKLGLKLEAQNFMQFDRYEPVPSNVVQEIIEVKIS